MMDGASAVTARRPASAYKLRAYLIVLLLLSEWAHALVSCFSSGIDRVRAGLELVGLDPDLPLVLAAYAFYNKNLSLYAPPATTQVFVAAAAEDALYRCLAGWRTSTCMSVASAGLITYDYYLTLFDEIRLLWKPRITAGSILFFLARYPGLAATFINLLPDSVAVDNICTILRLVAIISSEGILGLRAWAIWERSRRILVTLITLAVLCIAAAAVVVQKDVTTSSWKSISSSFPGPLPVNCKVIVSASKQLWAIPYIVTIIFEGVTLALTLVRIRKWRMNIPVSARSSLLDIIWRDGLAYYILMLCFGIVNIGLVVQLATPQLRSGGASLQTTFHSLLSTRAVLSLSASAGSPLGITKPSVSSMVFTSHMPPSPGSENALPVADTWAGLTEDDTGHLDRLPPSSAATGSAWQPEHVELEVVPAPETV